MNSEYISVQEFSELVGVPHQTIYRKINNDAKYKQFVKEIDGKKRINKGAAELFKTNVRKECEQSAHDVRTECAMVEMQLRDQLKVQENNFNERFKVQEKEYNLRSEFYEKQLADRDEQIAFLKEQLAKRDEELSAQRDLTANAQKLHLVAESKIAAIEDKQNKSWFQKFFKAKE